MSHLEIEKVFSSTTTTDNVNNSNTSNNFNNGGDIRSNQKIRTMNPNSTLNDNILNGNDNHHSTQQYHYIQHVQSADSINNANTTNIIKTFKPNNSTYHSTKQPNSNGILSPPSPPVNFLPQNFVNHQKFGEGVSSHSNINSSSSIIVEDDKVSPNTSPNLLNGFESNNNNNKNVLPAAVSVLNSTTPTPTSLSTTTTPSLGSQTPTSPSLTESPGKKKFVSNNLSVGVLSKDKINLLLVILKQKNHIQSIDQKISIYLSLEELIALILEELQKRKIPLSKCGIRLVGSTASNIISHTKQDKHYDVNDIDLNFYLYRVTNFTNLLDLEETVIAREVFRQTGIVISKKEVFNNFFRERVKVLNYSSTANTPIPILHPKQLFPPTPTMTPISMNTQETNNPLAASTTPLIPLPKTTSTGTTLSQPTTPTMTPILNNNPYSMSTPSTPTSTMQSPIPPSFTSEVSDDWSLISLGCDGDTPRNIDIKFIRKISRAYAFSLDSFHIILDPIVENYQSLLPYKNIDQSYKDIPIPLEPIHSQPQQAKYKNNNSIPSLYSTNNIKNNNHVNNSNFNHNEENEKLNISTEKDEILNNNNNNESMNLDLQQQSKFDQYEIVKDTIEPIKVEKEEEDLEVSNLIVPEQSNESQSGSSPMVSPPSLSTTNSVSSSTSSQNGSSQTTASNDGSNESSPSPLSFSLSPTSSTDSFSLLTNNNSSSQEDGFQPLSLDSQNNKLSLKTSNNSILTKKQAPKHSTNEEFPPLNNSLGDNKTIITGATHQNSWNQNLAQKLNIQSEEKKKYLETIVNHNNQNNIINNNNISLNSSNNSLNSANVNGNSLSSLSNNSIIEAVNENKDIDKQPSQPPQPPQSQKKKKVGNQKNRNIPIENQLPNNIRVKVISIYGNYCKAKNDLEVGRLNSYDPKQIRRGIFRYCHELAKGRYSTEPSYFDRIFRETFYTQDLMKPSEFQTTLLKYIKKHKNLAMTFLQLLESLLIQPLRIPSPIPISLIPITSSSLLPIPTPPSSPQIANLINSTSTTPSNSTPSSPTMIDSVSNDPKVVSNFNQNLQNHHHISPHLHNNHHINNHHHHHINSHYQHSPHLHNHPPSPSMGISIGPLIIESNSSPSINNLTSGGLPPIPLHPHSPKPINTITHSPKTYSNQTPTFYDLFYMEYINIISYLRSKLISGDIDSIWEKKLI